ncbi:MAG: hypothetical protein V4538_05665 [Bacteroidota bacterium]
MMEKFQIIIKKKLSVFVKIIALAGLFILGQKQALSQVLDSTKLKSNFKLSAKYIQADELGNIYVVSATNQLYKYDQSGKILATLNYNYSGNITSIDASNPMELYVFYKEINRVIFLDNNLAYRGEIDLTKSNIIQASSVARSYDNGLWVFDLGDLQLKKLDKEGKQYQSSGNIKQFCNFNFVPNYLADNGKQVILSNDSVILFFDVFASYTRTLKVNNATTLQLGTEYLFHTSANHVNMIDLKIGIVKNSFSFSYSYKTQWAFVSKEYIYCFDGSNIFIFSRD